MKNASSTRLRIKFVLFALLLAGAGASCLLLYWKHGPGHKVMDQELLREAVAECRKMNVPPPGEILEQQAGQGYYDDAMATGRLLRDEGEQTWAIEQIARIEAENGDAAGAKRMLAQFAGMPVFKSATLAIALAQANTGNREGAVSTAAFIDDDAVDQVLQAIVNQQVEDRDLSGAIKTSERMKTRQWVQAYYAITGVFKGKHRIENARELALQVTDHQRRKAFLDIASYEPGPPHVMMLAATPCAVSPSAANTSDYAPLDSVLMQNKCEYVAYFAERQYEVDPAGAERLLRSEPFNDDRVYGLMQIAIKAARKGELKESLRLYGDLQNLASSAPLPHVSYSLVEVAKEIARDWSIKEGPKPAIQWARSRRDDLERVWAMLGVAQALAHARPAVRN